MHRFALAGIFAILSTLTFFGCANAQDAPAAPAGPPGGSLAPAAAAPAGGAALAADDPYKRLPPGEGREIMTRVCSECHDPERAADERRDLEGFQALMGEMQGNGAVATDEEFEKIAQYLAKSFPPGKPKDTAPPAP